MAVDREPFWEVPLQLEINIDLKNDSCLVPAEQITLRERDYNKPSRMNDTYDEVCLYFTFLLLGYCCDTIFMFSSISCLMKVLVKPLMMTLCLVLMKTYHPLYQ